MDYNHREIEPKWREQWASSGLYKVTNDVSKPKYYVLDMFPYPSGAGLHVGHPLGYIASDIVARYKTQKGFNVLHPMGYDAFGLPAEQYAISTGVHPAVSTNENIQRYRSQLDNLGFNYDWSREVRTCDPSYYKWTQWIFIQLFEHYYDTEFDKAVLVEALIEKFNAEGNVNIQAVTSQTEFFTADQWHEKDEVEKAEILMNYRLAYRKIGYVNWCEALGTVLANDEVKDGVSERGGHPVERRPMMQWSLRITAYAERLLSNLDTLDWPDALKAMQQNWIGRSEGAQMFFDIDGHDIQLEIFTTRPDTIFGATYMVIAPEHDLVELLTTPGQKTEIEACITYVKNKSERERMAEVKEMNGAFTGAYAINPFNQERIPIWIGDYVLKDYGTGAIMAVPSDDERDMNFAKKYQLPIIDVVDKSKYPGATLHDKLGIIINSDFLNGMEVPEAIQLMFEKIEAMGIGKKRVNYKLRDANFSRQRYWGEPFPIKYDEKGIPSALGLDELPLELPDLDDFKPTADGKSPLSRLTSWVSDGTFERETDTMPGFAGSSWYFLRYMDAGNEEEFASAQAVDYWKEVDFYIGGAEHAVGHLMYSRFWHKFLYDKGLVPTEEPFKKLVNQGMIQGVIESIYLLKSGEANQHHFYSEELTESMPEAEFAKIPVHVDYVAKYGSPDSHLNPQGIASFCEWRPEYKDAIFHGSAGSGTVAQLPQDFKLMTKSEVGKMSKRYFNVVNPDDMVDRYGADCFRMYEMFLGPIEQSKPWDTKGIDGVSKFIRKFWNLIHFEGVLKISDEKPTAEEYKILHTAIKKVSDDIERFSLNTTISNFMVCVNELKRINCNKREIIHELVKLMAPFAPFITEELHARLGGEGSVHKTQYPVVNEAYLVEDSVVYPVCINGKKRDELTVPNGMPPAEVEKLVLGMDGLEKWLDKPIKKVIVVPGRMINIVV
ncbi:MAG: leucine--tRNA ligase [Saprospiraceae bacterium]|nr:leucine--tRNA ligase [Saprospiraceae bacterium]